MSDEATKKAPAVKKPSDGSPGKRKKHKNSQNMIVIHVCDESKKINQDFHCPRDLLVEEMKYFAEYLATDIKQCEEVDISVHCDVQIFDWLMRYVQRDKTVAPDQCPNMPKLEPNNVISILISSDFLKMECLVKICVEYCHTHMSDIISAPCNMNCISGPILTDIAKLFTLSEIEGIRDRKDKFKSKLFAKKVEFLFEPSEEANASDLFRCVNCKRLLSSRLQSKVPCTTGRMTVGFNGILMYSHTKDMMFNISEHLVSLRHQAKTWRDIYWILWSTVNYMSCSHCQHTFPLAEYYECLHHTADPVFKDGDDQISAAVGVYPCCKQKTLRFDPLTCPKGCEKMKHSVPLGKEDYDTERFSEHPANLIMLFEKHEDVITAKPLPVSDSTTSSTVPTEYNMFLYEELACGVAPPTSTSSDKIEKQPSLGSLQHFEGDCESVEGVEEDETEDEEVTQIIKRRQQTKKARGRGSRGTGRTPKSSETSNDRVEIYVESVSSDGSRVMGGGDYASSKIRWDSRRSRRWNQDAQRDDDYRRTGELVTQLNNLKIQMKRTDITKSKECHPGGIYYNLENKFKTQRSSSKDTNSNRISKRKTMLSIP